MLQAAFGDGPGLSGCVRSRRLPGGKIVERCAPKILQIRGELRAVLLLNASSGNSLRVPWRRLADAEAARSVLYALPPANRQRVAL
jgi:hypothetical protein